MKNKENDWNLYTYVATVVDISYCNNIISQMFVFIIRDSAGEKVKFYNIHLELPPFIYSTSHTNLKLINNPKTAFNNHSV